MTDEFAALLSPYLDDELPAGERRRVEGHLAECAVCRAELEALREGSLLLAAARVEAPVMAPEWGLRRRFRRRAARLFVQALLVVALVGVAVAAMPPITRSLQPDLPLWFRLCRAVAVGLLASPALLWLRELLRDVSSLVEYGWLSGGER